MKRIFAALCGAMIAVSAVSCGKNGSKTSIEVFKDTDQVIWDNEALTVTFVSYEDAVPLEPVINLKVLNKTDSDRSLTLNDLYVNDFSMFAAAFLDNSTVPPGETADASINFYSGAVENAGIEEIGKVTLSFHTVNPKATSMDDAFLVSDGIDIFTDNKEWEKNQKMPEGELIYDEDGVRITAVLSGDSYMRGYTLPLFIENNSKENIAMWLDSMRFDGAEGEMNIPEVGNILSGKRSLRTMVTYSALESAGITAYDVFSSDSDANRPEKTEVKFTIKKYDGKGGEKSTETDYIEIKGLS